MKIKTKILISLLTELLKKTEKLGFKEIEIDIDYYWTIPMKEGCKIYDKQEPGVGSLIDDWNSINKAFKGKTLTPLDFERLGNIIKALGVTIDKSGKIFL